MIGETDLHDIRIDGGEIRVFLCEKERLELEKRGFYILKVKNTFNAFLSRGLLLFFLTFIFTPFLLHYIYGVFVFMSGNPNGVDFDVTRLLTINGIYLSLFGIPSIIYGINHINRVLAEYFKLKYIYIHKRNNGCIQYLIGNESNTDKQIKLLNSGLGKTNLPRKVFVSLLFSSFIGITLLSYYIPFILGLFIAFVIITIFLFSKKSSYNLYGNLGEKIQSLTSQIGEQSEMIQKEFSSTMDFRILSKSFDTLASTFSKIVGLVVKLEQVEKKANKGDLFDSTKYINSLREDIRTPLFSLKTFLETKKIELASSQKELSRVRVSVGGEGENRELQSIRSEELMKELDNNILKLDEMIGKL